MPLLELEDITLCYEQIGSGPDLILVMGLGGQLAHWHPSFVDMLAEDFRVTIFDNRDVGCSTHFSGSGSLPKAVFQATTGRPVDAPYTLKDMAQDTVKLMNGLAIPEAFAFGISMGGMIVQELALLAPQRIKGLVSMMSSPGGARHAAMGLRPMQVLLQKPAIDKEDSIKKALAFWKATRGSVYRHDEAFIISQAERAWERDQDKTGTARQFLAILATRSRLQRLASIKAPALVIHGSDDRLILPSAGRATANAIPGAYYLEISGLGHEMAPACYPIIGTMMRSLAS